MEKKVKEPRKFTNDELAQHLELWALLNEELTINQLSYFDEIIFRLRLTRDKELENG